MPDGGEPLVVALLKQFKQELLAREAAQMRALAQRWTQVERALDAQLAALAEEAARRRAAGEIVSQATIYQLERYRALRAQAVAEIGQYVRYADGAIAAGQRECGALGLRESSDALSAVLQPAGIVAGFEQLPVAAVEALVGLTAEGTPLRSLLVSRCLPGALDGVVEALLQGVALGWNPVKTAREMRDGLAGGLAKALVIARTEQLRVYRTMSWQQYQASGIVRGMMRLTAHDGRVCAACLADEGRLYPLDAPLSDHPQGRCTGVPVVIGLPEPRWLSGEAWLRTQPTAVQESILGRARLQRWQEGTVQFSDFVTLQHSDVWGAEPRPTPLRALGGA